MLEAVQTTRIVMNRAWAMPSADTLSIKPIRGLVKKYLYGSKVSVDPFARNCTWATYTNDLNPDTAAEYHMDAERFSGLMVSMLTPSGGADVVIFDPPYSTRQTKECYQAIGLDMPYNRTIGWGELKNNLAFITKVGGYCLSFGWNSIGLGRDRGFEIKEILLVCHGRIHNDTICTVEQKIESPQCNLFPKEDMTEALAA